MVTCIMPTADRREFIPAAIACWREQTYPNAELVILDDGTDRIKDCIEPDERIVYLAVSPRISIGEKRNWCCRLARGEVICHWDDDDWSAPERISDQVGRLIETGKPVTGYGTLLFWDVDAGRAKRYKATVKNYVCGTSLCYRRELWQKHPFKDKVQAEDNAFIYPILSQVAQSNDTGFMVARIHGHNHTSSKAAIKEVVSRDMIPEAFWENERLRTVR